MDTVDYSRFFKNLTDALPFAVYVAFPDGTVHYGNRAAEETTGYLSQEIVGHTCLTLLACCDTNGTSMCGGAQCPLNRAARQGPDSRLVFITNKSGVRLPVVIRAIPLDDQNGTAAPVAYCFRAENDCEHDSSWIEDSDPQIDPAIGIYSIETTQRQLQAMNHNRKNPVAVFSIEIDHIDDLAKKHGTEMIRLGLRTVIHSLRHVLHMPHYLGRWKKDVLLLIIPECASSMCSELQDTLRVVGNACSVTWWGDRISLHVLVRGTTTRTGERAEDVLARLSLLNAGEPLGDLNPCS